MNDVLMYTIIALVSFGAASYFALLWKFVSETHSTSGNIKADQRRDFSDLNNTLLLVGKSITGFTKSFTCMEKMNSETNARIIVLENEIRLQKSDSSRLREWLEDEEKRRNQQYEELVKALKVEAREAMVIELAKRVGHGQVIKK